jgi:HK97 family phage prohead protease
MDTNKSYKDFSIKAPGLNESGQFECYVSTFGPPADSHGDVVAPGAFLQDLRERGDRRPLLWMHDPAQSCGWLSDLREDAYGLKARGSFLLELPLARDVYVRAKAGLVRFSIGYDTLADHHDRAGGYRVLTRVKLWESSAVTFAANERAVLTDIKDSSLAAALDTLSANIRATTAAMQTSTATPTAFDELSRNLRDAAGMAKAGVLEQKMSRVRMLHAQGLPLAAERLLSEIEYEIRELNG